MRGHIFAAVLAAFAAVLVYFAFYFLPLAQPPETIEKPPEAYKDSKTHQRGTEKIPFVVKILPGEDDKSKTEAERTKKHKEAVNEHALVWATMALAVFTLALAIFTAYLWSSTSKLVSDSDETSKKELRAYVGVIYPEIRIDGGKLIAWFDYQNTGQTPAKAVELKMSAEIYDGTVESPEWRSPGTHRDKGKGGVMVPGTTWQKYCPVSEKERPDVQVIFNKKVRADLTSDPPKQKVWVWGTITYVDIFEKKNTVKFRFWSGTDIRKHPTNATFPRKGRYIPLIADGKHTDADYGKKG